MNLKKRRKKEEEEERRDWFKLTQLGLIAYIRWKKNERTNVSKRDGEVCGVEGLVSLVLAVVLELVECLIDQEDEDLVADLEAQDHHDLLAVQELESVAAMWVSCGCPKVSSSTEVEAFRPSEVVEKVPLDSAGHY